MLSMSRRIRLKQIKLQQLQIPSWTAAVAKSAGETRLILSPPRRRGRQLSVAAALMTIFKWAAPIMWWAEQTICLHACPCSSSITNVSSGSKEINPLLPTASLLLVFLLRLLSRSVKTMAHSLKNNKGGATAMKKLAVIGRQIHHHFGGSTPQLKLQG